MRGGTVVGDDEEGSHVFSPVCDPDPVERGHFLEAYKAVQALQHAWDKKQPSTGRPGEHQDLPYSMISELLEELHYPPELWGSLALQLGIGGDSEDSGTEDEPEARHRRRWMRRLEKRVNAFTGQKEYHRGDITRRIFHGKHQASDSEQHLSFQALAVLLQPFGLAHLSRDVSLDRLIREMVQRQSN